ncbi:unnamed protein product [Protopolystoma xenopodis]|uniref:Uncharacterized protein n=1 Tax=Protopolystoma xenopodis TaxID=117903 RepID=A0A448WKM1_9PLAT|nr:unnamed protein product [Protopolystoma xenopodis]
MCFFSLVPVRHVSYARLSHNEKKRVLSSLIVRSAFRSAPPNILVNSTFDGIDSGDHRMSLPSDRLELADWLLQDIATETSALGESVEVEDYLIKLKTNVLGSFGDEVEMSAMNETNGVGVEHNCSDLTKESEIESIAGVETDYLTSKGSSRHQSNSTFLEEFTENIPPFSLNGKVESNETEVPVSNDDAVAQLGGTEAISGYSPTESSDVIELLKRNIFLETIENVINEDSERLSNEPDADTIAIKSVETKAIGKKRVLLPVSGPGPLALIDLPEAGVPTIHHRTNNLLFFPSRRRNIGTYSSGEIRKLCEPTMAETSTFGIETMILASIAPESESFSIKRPLERMVGRTRLKKKSYESE